MRSIGPTSIWPRFHAAPSPERDPVRWSGALPASFGRAFIVALLVGAAVNAVLFAMNPPHPSASLGSPPRMPWINLLLVTSLLPWITYTLRMMNWLAFLGHPLGFRGTLKVAVGAEVSAVFGPSTLTSSGAKALLLLEQSTPPAVVLSLMSLIALEDFIFVACCLPASFFLACPPDLRERMASHLPSWPGINEPVGTAVGLAIAAVVTVSLVLWVRRCPSKIAERLRQAARNMAGTGKRVLAQGKGRFAVNLLLTVGQWACRYTFVTLIAMAFGFTVNIPLFFLLHWLVYTGANMTPTPGSAGGAEVAFYLFFGMVLPSPFLPWAALGWRFFSFYYPVLVGSLVLAFLAIKPRPTRDDPPAVADPPPLGSPGPGPSRGWTRRLDIFTSLLPPPSLPVHRGSYPSIIKNMEVDHVDPSLHPERPSGPLHRGGNPSARIPAGQYPAPADPFPG
jgi:uncharacterized membrane protein YbhN (UPF0104 family)